MNLLDHEQDELGETPSATIPEQPANPVDAIDGLDSILTLGKGDGGASPTFPGPGYGRSDAVGGEPSLAAIELLDHPPSHPPTLSNRDENIEEKRDSFPAFDAEIEPRIMKDDSPPLVSLTTLQNLSGLSAEEEPRPSEEPIDGDHPPISPPKASRVEKDEGCSSGNHEALRDRAEASDDSTNERVSEAASATGTQTGASPKPSAPPTCRLLGRDEGTCPLECTTNLEKDLAVSDMVQCPSEEGLSPHKIGASKGPLNVEYVNMQPTAELLDPTQLISIDSPTSPSTPDSSVTRVEEERPQMASQQLRAEGGPTGDAASTLEPVRKPCNPDDFQDLWVDISKPELERGELLSLSTKCDDVGAEVGGGVKDKGLTALPLANHEEQASESQETVEATDLDIVNGSSGEANPPEPPTAGVGNGTCLSGAIESSIAPNQPSESAKNTEEDGSKEHRNASPRVKSMAYFTREFESLIIGSRLHRPGRLLELPEEPPLSTPPPQIDQCGVPGSYRSGSLFRWVNESTDGGVQALHGVPTPSERPLRTGGAIRGRGMRERGADRQRGRGLRGAGYARAFRGFARGAPSRGGSSLPQQSYNRGTLIRPFSHPRESGRVATVVSLDTALQDSRGKYRPGTPGRSSVDNITVLPEPGKLLFKKISRLKDGYRLFRIERRDDGAPSPSSKVIFMRSLIKKTPAFMTLGNKLRLAIGEVIFRLKRDSEPGAVVPSFSEGIDSSLLAEKGIGPECTSGVTTMFDPICPTSYEPMLRELIEKAGFRFLESKKDYIKIHYFNLYDDRSVCGAKLKQEGGKWTILKNAYHPPRPMNCTFPRVEGKDFRLRVKNGSQKLAPTDYLQSILPSIQVDGENVSFGPHQKHIKYLRVIQTHDTYECGDLRLKMTNGRSPGNTRRKGIELLLSDLQLDSMIQRGDKAEAKGCLLDFVDFARYLCKKIAKAERAMKSKGALPSPTVRSTDQGGERTEGQVLGGGKRRDDGQE